MRRDLAKEERLAVIQVIKGAGGEGFTSLIEKELKKLDVQTRGMSGDPLLIANGQRQALAWILGLLTESERAYRETKREGVF